MDKIDTDLQNRVLYKDSLLLVLNKPAGLAVHGGPSGADNLERHLDALRFGITHAPKIAHRLDSDTEGCLALARNERAVSKLSKIFEERSLTKTYWAVVQGQFPDESGLIDAPLAKISSKEEGWRMIVDPANGKPAQTRYQVLGRSAHHSWMEFELLTGRTHQLRIHCLHMGCPIVGDPVYGTPGAHQTRLHLLARQLILPFYQDRDPICITAPVPPHMIEALTACGYRAEVPCKS